MGGAEGTAGGVVPLADVVVWSSARAVAWPRPTGPDAPRDLTGEPIEPGAYPIVPILEALTTHHTTEAHATGVLLAGETRQPRISKVGLSRLLADNHHPHLHVLLVDVDRDPHEPWPNGADGPEARAFVELVALLCPDAGVYTTRRGARLVWVLERPVHVEHIHSWVTMYLEHLRAEGFEGLTGMRLDGCSADWHRGFRLPHTPAGGPTLTDFTALERGMRLDWTPPSPTTAGRRRTKTAVAHDADFGECPEMADLRDRLPSPHDWATLRATPGLEEVAPRLAAGAPYADPGARDTTLTRGMGATVRALLHLHRPDLDNPTDAAIELAERAMAVWLPSLESALDTDPDGTAPGTDKAWRHATTFAATDVDELVQEENTRAALAEALSAPEVASIPLDHVDHPDPPAAKTSSPSTSSHVDHRPPSAPPEVVWPDPDGPPLPTVVLIGDKRYSVLDTTDKRNGYGEPVPSVALPREITLRAPDLAADAFDGKGRPHGAGHILARVGAVAHKVSARYVDDTDPAPRVNTFDPVTGTFCRSVCAPLETTPRYHADVAAWLYELSGGRNDELHEALLDWLATVSVLSRATTTLYLRGPDSVGKTLFAHGVAALWGDAPVSFSEATGRFNVGLLSSPIVHLSEGVDNKRLEKDGASSAFRALSGDGRHTIELKFEGTTALLGHPRMIIGANNDDALPLGSAHHTRDDLGAIAKRVLYVRSSARAAQVLAHVPVSRLATWAQPNGPIPQHIAHLIHTRREAALSRASRRFLVQGRESVWHRALLLYSGHNEAALGAVADSVIAGNPCTSVEPRAPQGAPKGAECVPERARVWVNVAALHRAWRTIVDEDGPRPTRAVLARTIRDLSPSERSSSRVAGGRGGKPRGGGTRRVRCWDVPGDLVLRVAEAHNVDALDVLKDRLAGRLSRVGGGAARGMAFGAGEKSKKSH